MTQELKNLQTALDERIEKFNLQTEGKLGEKEAALKNEIKNITESINEKMGIQQEQMDKIHAEVKKYREQGASAGHALKLTLAGHIERELKSDKLKGQWENYQMTKKGGPVLDLAMKAVGTMTTSASLTETAGTIIQETRVPGVKGLIERTTRLRDLLPGGSTNSNQVLYVKEVAGEGSVGTTAEGGAKSQIDFDLQSAVAPVRKIAGHTKISEELLTDLSAMASFLGMRIPQKIKLVEDTQIFSGDGNSPNLTGLSVNANDGTGSGIVADAVIQNWDVLIAAASERRQSDYSVNGIVLNPADFDQMLLVKGTDDHYVAPFIWQNGVPTLRGIPIYLNTVITAGNFLMGDWLNGAQIFDRMGVNVRFYDQDEDNAQKNLVTVVGEERLALAIYYDDAFTYGNFDTLKVEISS